MPPRIAVRDISFFERQVPFTKPFRLAPWYQCGPSIRACGDRDRRRIHVGGCERRADGANMVRQLSQLTPEQTVEEFAPVAGIGAISI